MSQKKIAADLQRLVKKASEVKTAAIKQAEGGVAGKLDGLDGGESKASTGAQAAANKKESAKGPGAKVDGGAVANAEGASVEKSTDGAAAASADGKSGAKGGELGSADGAKAADNGPEMKNKFAAAKDLVARLRKEAEAPKAEVKVAAAANLSKFDKFLVKQARAALAENPQTKVAADGMEDGAVADQASDALMQQLESGQISEEDATQILQEALQSGAITPEELQQAAQLADQQGAGGAPAAEGAPADAGADAAMGGAEGAPVDAAQDAGMGAPMDAGAPAPEDADLQAKLASAQVGPDHPQYMQKLAAVYGDDLEAGAALFAKVAEYLVKAAEESEKSEGRDPKARAEHESKETPAQEANEEGTGKLVDSMAGVNLAPVDEAEKKALEAVKKELGVGDDQLKMLADTPIPDGKNQDKTAAAITKYRIAILSKVAALKN